MSVSLPVDRHATQPRRARQALNLNELPPIDSLFPGGPGENPLMCPRTFRCRRSPTEAETVLCGDLEDRASFGQLDPTDLCSGCVQGPPMLELFGDSDMNRNVDPSKTCEVHLRESEDPEAQRCSSGGLTTSLEYITREIPSGCLLKPLAAGYMLDSGAMMEMQVMTGESLCDQ
ncbi:hypothetical protein B0H19DRAFT_1067637 [Mycena capillaripes]|nr:hypothetical protein B0H19DRAFT_1067637 [Mycena capillaripes]